MIGELAKECGIRLLSIDVKCRNRLKAAYPFYSEYTIPAGTYTGQTEEVKTLSVQAVLLAGDSLSENTVKELTELLFLHGKDIRYAASIELKEDEQSRLEVLQSRFIRVRRHIMQSAVSRCRQSKYRI